MRPLYIIDFSNFAYKFKSVYKFSHVDIKGVTVDTSVLFGFTKALQENPFDDICVVLDGIPSRSLKVLPSYKGQRLHDDEKQGISVPKKEVIQYLTDIGNKIKKNVFVVCAALQETDEVISSIVHIITNNMPPKAQFLSKLNTRELSQDRMLRYLDGPDLNQYDYDFSQYSHAVIASTDGDFIQLQRFPNVSIDTSTSGKVISDNRQSDSTQSLNPAATVAYKAIYGDASDNIPAISLSFKKDNVLRVLNTKVTNSEELLAFHQGCRVGKHEDKLLNVICKEINTYHYPMFAVNWEVAFLVFRSFPKVLLFDNYDADTTISKYRIKVRARNV